MTKSSAAKATIEADEDEAIRRVIAELKSKLARTEKEYALARYALGERVVELSRYSDGAVAKLAAALGRGYGIDNLRIYRRIAETWPEATFRDLLSKGLTVSDFRELWKVSDASVRAKLEQEAIASTWSNEQLKQEVRKAIAAERKTASHEEREIAESAVAPAVPAVLDEIIRAKKPQLEEQARLRARLRALGEHNYAGLEPEVTKARDAVRDVRAALDETEALLEDALRRLAQNPN